MKASRFSDAQKAFIQKQPSEGMPVTAICRKAGISQATYFNWKRKHDGLLPTEVRRLKHNEDESTMLRQVVADLSLDEECCVAFCVDSSRCELSTGCPLGPGRAS